MKVFQVLIHNSYASNDCVVADSIGEAEKAFHKIYSECRIRAITELYSSVIIANKEAKGDALLSGKTDWHNWMRDTMHIDPNDKRTIEIVWACIVRCQADFENEFCHECAKNTEQLIPPDKDTCR